MIFSNLRTSVQAFDESANEDGEALLDFSSNPDQQNLRD
jgi:hypothetical protein